MSSSSVVPSTTSQQVRLDPDDDERDHFIKTYGWGRPTAETIAEIVRHSPLIEVCAGSGKLAADVLKAGGDIIATDLKNNYWKDFACEMLKMDAVIAASNYPSRTLLMVWPPNNDPLAARVISAYKGKRLLYIGEARGGCTANSEFFDILDAGWDLESIIPVKQFNHIKDMLWVLVRKEGGGRKIPDQFAKEGETIQPYHLSIAECMEQLAGVKFGVSGNRLPPEGVGLLNWLSGMYLANMLPSARD